MSKVKASEIIAKKVLTEQDIQLLCRRANAGEQIPEITKEYKLTLEHTAKRLEWLKKQWKTPRGIERKNNPFGYREQETLETAKKMTFDGLYNNGNANINYYIPIYSVIGKKASFQYILNCGKVKVIN